MILRSIHHNILYLFLVLLSISLLAGIAAAIPAVNQPGLITPHSPSDLNKFVWVNATQSSITFDFSASDEETGIYSISIEIRKSPLSELLSGPNKTLVYSGRINSTSGTYTISNPVSNTAYTARAEAFDRAGGRSGWSSNITVIYDNVFPNLTIDNSSNHITVNSKSSVAIITGKATDDEDLPNNVQVHAEVIDSGNTSYIMAMPAPNNTFVIQIENITNTTTVKVIASDLAGNKVIKTLSYYKDVVPPIITVTEPMNDTWTGARNMTVSGIVYDNYEVEYLSVNDLKASLSGTNWFKPAVLNWNIDMELFEGNNTFYIKAKDPEGNTASTTLVVYADFSSPILNILSPEEGAVITQSSARISGIAWDNTGVAAVYVNSNLTTGIFGSKTVDWYYDVPLNYGINTFTITAVDDMNNRVSRNITLIRHTGTPSIQIKSPLNGEHLGTEFVYVNGTAYDSDGISKIKIDVISLVPGGNSTLTDSYTLYPSNMSLNSTGVASWSKEIKLALGMNIIEARAYDVESLTASTAIYVVYTDVPVITVNGPARRVYRTDAAGILASGTARTNNTHITNISLRIYNSDGVTVADADIHRTGNTSVTWSYPISMPRYGTYAVELRAYIDNEDYSKKEFIVNRIPANFTLEYAYPETQGEYAKYNITSKNTIDYYDFVKESPDNGSTMNYLIHEYIDWGEGWWKIKDNQTLSSGVRDNSGEVAGLPNYTWSLKRLLGYNLTWVAHMRWDYQDTPPDDEGYENMVGWFKDRQPPNYPPYVSVDVLADPADANLSWYTGNLTQHGWVKVNPSVWDWNRYYEPQFPEPLKLDWTFDGIPVPPQVYVGQRPGHDEGDTGPAPPPGVFWLPTTGVHTIGLTVKDSGLSGIDDKGTIIYNPLQGSGTKSVTVYNDPPVISDVNVSMLDLTNSYSTDALQYLSLAGEIPSSDPLHEGIAPWSSLHNPVHIGRPADIILDATDPNIEDMQYKDYLHYRYIWGDGYETGWLKSTPTQDELITSTELVWNQTSLFPRMNEQAANKTHRYTAWADSSRFILNETIGITVQAMDPYAAVTTYKDSIFVYDNPPRKPTVVSINTTKKRNDLPSNGFKEKGSIIFRYVSYDPDNPAADPDGDTVYYHYDWGDGTESVWSASGSAEKKYFPTHWDFVDGKGRQYNIYYVTITVKDEWGLTSNSNAQILIYKNEPPKVTIRGVQFNGIELVHASPEYFCGYDCQRDSRFRYSINPSVIDALIEDPDGDSVEATYEWGMGGKITNTNQYTFGYAVYRRDETNPPEWIWQYHYGWNLGWDQYVPGTYTIVVRAVDEYGAETVAVTTATAYPPINAIGDYVISSSIGDYSYDESGFYTELRMCGSFSCTYDTGYILDHYGMARSATAIGNSIMIEDALGGTHSGSISGSDYGAIRSYVAGMLGVPVS
jgi:hypothetical protein